MATFLRVMGYTFRASALICIVWIASQVVSGHITTLPVLLQSLAFHAVFASAGVALVGQSRRMPVRSEVAE